MVQPLAGIEFLDGPVQKPFFHDYALSSTDAERDIIRIESLESTCFFNGLDQGANSAVLIETVQSRLMHANYSHGGAVSGMGEREEG